MSAAPPLPPAFPTGGWQAPGPRPGASRRLSRAQPGHSTAGGSQLSRSDGCLLGESTRGGRPRVSGEPQPRHHLQSLSLSHSPHPRARGSSCAGSGGHEGWGSSCVACRLWGALRLGVALGGTRHTGTSTPDPSSLNEVRPAGGSSQTGSQGPTSPADWTGELPDARASVVTPHPTPEGGGLPAHPEEGGH